MSNSTFAIGSGSLLFLIPSPVLSVKPLFGLNPVFVVVVFPSTVTTDCVTHFNKLKSNKQYYFKVAAYKNYKNSKNKTVKAIGKYVKLKKPVLVK